MANKNFTVKNGLDVANSYIVANSTVLAIGTNVSINSTATSIGNSTSNSIQSQLVFSVANSTSTVNVSTAGLLMGTTVVNSSVFFAGNSTSNTTANLTSESFSNSTVTSIYGLAGANVGANVIVTTTGISLGNSTVNTTVSSTGIKFADNNTQNTAAYGKTMVWIPAGAMKSRTTGGATANTIETATNKINLDVFDFDPTVNNHVQFNMRMPKSWNGSTVSAQFVWYQANTSTSFGSVWSLAGLALSNNALLDTAVGTPVQVTSTGAVNNAVYISPETTAITIANAAAQSIVVFEVKRVATDAADTMTITSKLLGVNLFITTNTTNDA